MSQSLQVNTIRFTQIGIYEKAEIQLGKVTVFQGKNGLGKTTIHDGVLSAIGKPDQSLITDGFGTGTIDMDLSNGQRVERILSRDGETEVTVFDVDGTPRKRSKEFIAALCDTRAVNPITFLTAKPKEQIDWLLQAVELKLTDEQRTEFMKLNDDAELLDKDIISYIDATREIIYDRRTKAHGAVENTEGHITKLKELVPFEFDPNLPRPDVSAMESERDALVKTFTEKSNAVKQIFERARTSQRDESSREIAEKKDKVKAGIDSAKLIAQTKIDEINAALQKEIGVLNDELQEYTATRGKEADTAVSELQETFDADMLALRAEYQPLIDEKREAISTARNEDLTFERNVANFNNLDKANAELCVEQGKWQVLDDSVNWIDRAKVDIMRALPFDLEIRGGFIYRNNIPWRKLNTAQRVEIAVGLAEERAGQLKIICLDGAECLDEDNFNALIERCRKSTCQCLIFMVGNTTEIKETKYSALEMREAA